MLHIYFLSSALANNTFSGSSACVFYHSVLQLFESLYLFEPMNYTVVHGEVLLSRYHKIIPNSCWLTRHSKKRQESLEV